jgi:hypothetical protein
MEVSEMLVSWECCWKDADHESEHWAATDRGWLYVDGVAVGNYLDYSPLWPDDYVAVGGGVHAVLQKPSRKSACFPTPHMAMAWMEATAVPNGQMPLPLS